MGKYLQTAGSSDRQIVEHNNVPILVYAPNAALTWTVANSGGFLQLTSSGVHGLTIQSYTNSYLHVKTASGSFFAVDQLVPITTVTSTTQITTGTAWDAAMAGATPVFSMAGDKFKILTVAVPALRLGSRVIVDSNWAYPNNANSKNVDLQFGGTSYYNPSAFTTTLVAYAPVVIMNKGATNSQEGRFNNTNATGSGTATAVPTSAVDTTAAASLVWYGTCATANDFIGVRSRLVEVIF